ncbi:hypothetical protein H310_14544 [Aphanomyces invadans]|uniref:VPS9 domain-containing protein n=1 Tax=Aphanomyces invadans TaxID=157072 RepID=A0A024T9M4_9STRA|nr:hypothetical protein H310_14544 [Aphanomyces invadans]ETV90704.1 hypothetical protein H310_14544 [Aphanomyces invadans]|eukprot:XP_008880644.1 hypothetical protein H310_14544 [Aphanomyces invadans]
MSMWLCHPVHLHSFVAAAEHHPATATSLFTKARPRVSCAICNDAVDRSRKEITTRPTCTCVSCNCVVHRRCLSEWHEQTTSTRHRNGKLHLSLCSVTENVRPTPSSQSLPPSPPNNTQHDLQLLEHLRLDPTLPESPLHRSQLPQPFNSLAYVYIQRYAPYVAGGILLGGAAIFGMPAVALTGLGVSISGHTWTQRRQSSPKDSDWARRICWDLKQSATGTDLSYKQDAALLRRYHNPTTDRPSADDIYRLLYHLFASRDELIGRVNSELCEAFRARAKASTALPAIVRDVQVYVGHVLAVAMTTYPALSSSEDAVVHTTEAVERLVYSDIYSLVFEAFRREYARHDATLTAHVREVQARRPGGSVNSQAVKVLVRLGQLTYPWGKLQVLGEAFRVMCTEVEARLTTAPSADTVLPTTMDLIVDGSGLTPHFVAQLAFVSTLTKGGGRGVEGYALTTFHAALRALAAIDLQDGVASVDELDDDEFFDAVDDLPR